MALVTQHIKDCVCVHHMEKCAYKQLVVYKTQSVKHITISCSKHGKRIIPKFCTRKNYTQKHLNRHFINKMVCTPRHKTLYNA